MHLNEFFSSARITAHVERVRTLLEYDGKPQKIVEHDGITVHIETPAGCVRKGVGQDGKPWQQIMKTDYGYIKGVNAPDGDSLDCFVPENPLEGAPVHIIHQMTPDGSSYDESKVVLGAESPEHAFDVWGRDAWKRQQMTGPISVFPLESFKKILTLPFKTNRIILCSAEQANVLRKIGKLAGEIQSIFEMK